METTLSLGKKGEEVRQLQDRLGKIGYHDVDRKLLADGKFGDRTRHAVEAFQYDYGLKVDGVVGVRTAAALNHAECAQKFISAVTRDS